MSAATTWLWIIAASLLAWFGLLAFAEAAVRAAA